MLFGSRDCTPASIKETTKATSWKHNIGSSAGTGSELEITAVTNEVGTGEIAMATMVSCNRVRRKNGSWDLGGIIGLNKQIDAITCRGMRR